MGSSLPRDQRRRGTGVARICVASGLAALLTEGTPVLAQARSVVFATQRACETARLLTQDECRNAFRNAAAEFDDNAPQSRSRSDCESHFGRCMISFAGSPARAGAVGSMRFAPQMRGVEVQVRSGRDKVAVPLLASQHPVVTFSGRPVTRLQDGRSARQQHQAQARWEEFLTRPAEPAPGASTPAFDEAEPSGEGEVPSFPVPKHRLPKLIDP
ncbi:DUF1190 domain-containing protein [Microvirga aerophila]|uniref:DUF1190 domain-containing protein n=1 Tax=Microvirga aerophila TaxID=670291 RepID=UPI0013B466BA|nr:DUF1190 domain-containing protein [Microvirga aerophila]